MGLCFSKKRKRPNLNGYLIEQKIFEGEKTQIFIVEKDKQKYILKSIDTLIEGSENNYFRELFHIRQFTHPNLVKFYDDFTINHRHYIVTEYVHGSDLFEHIQDFELSEKQLNYIMLQIVCGLHYMHTKNVAHLDLKLENILIDDLTNQIKIYNFGFSTDENMIVCERNITPYIAPENVGLGQCDPKKIDIWSLGICFYILATRSYPFNGTEAVEIFEKIKTEPINFEKVNLSYPGKDLLIQLLNRNPADRPNIEKVMIHEWFQTK
jgi:serine/threonine-protein kinase SRK2